MFYGTLLASFKLVSHKEMMSYLKMVLCASRIDVPITEREETAIVVGPCLSFNIFFLFCKGLFFFSFSRHIICNDRALAKEFSHNQGKPRNLQHITVK